MSVDKQFTKENLDIYLKELAKEFRKRNGSKMPAEIILIGGASVLIIGILVLGIAAQYKAA